jgi:hypothetical protein
MWWSWKGLISKLMNTLKATGALSILCLFPLSLKGGPSTTLPSAVVKEYYLAIGRGDLPKERSLYSTATTAFFNSQPPDRRAAMESGRTVTFGDTITGVEVTKENLQGDKAWVDVTIHYQHHADAHFNAGVINENGNWKIALN